MRYTERRTSDDAVMGISRWYVPLFVWRFAIKYGLLQRQPYRRILLCDMYLLACSASEEQRMSDFQRTTADARYKSDPQFAMVVNVLRSYMEQAHYTPTELREACHLAACMYEWEHVKPLMIDPKEPFKWNLRGSKSQ